MVCPVITMGEKTHAVGKKRLLGKRPAKESINRMSAEKHVTADLPPTFEWYGTADRSVHPENSRMLKESPLCASVPHVVEEYESIGHEADLATGTAVEPWFSCAVAFRKEQRQHDAILSAVIDPSKKARSIHRLSRRMLIRLDHFPRFAVMIFAFSSKRTLSSFAAVSRHSSFIPHSF